MKIFADFGITSINRGQFFPEGFTDQVIKSVVKPILNFLAQSFRFICGEKAYEMVWEQGLYHADECDVANKFVKEWGQLCPLGEVDSTVGLLECAKNRKPLSQLLAGQRRLSSGVRALQQNGFNAVET